MQLTAGCVIDRDLCALISVYKCSSGGCIQPNRPDQYHPCPILQALKPISIYNQPIRSFNDGWGNRGPRAWLQVPANRVRTSRVIRNSTTRAPSPHGPMQARSRCSPLQCRSMGARSGYRWWTWVLLVSGHLRMPVLSWRKSPCARSRYRSLGCRVNRFLHQLSREEYRHYHLF